MVQDAADKLEAELDKRHEEELAQRSVAEFGLADANDEPEDGKSADAPQVSFPIYSCSNPALGQSERERSQRHFTNLVRHLVPWYHGNLLSPACLQRACSTSGATRPEHSCRTMQHTAPCASHEAGHS